MKIVIIQKDMRFHEVHKSSSAELFKPLSKLLINKGLAELYWLSFEGEKNHRG